jgi:hypothetical protein
MSKLTKILIGYVVLIFIQAFLILVVFSAKYPEKYQFSFYYFIVFLLDFLIIQSPFIVLAIVGFKNENRRLIKGISEGYLIWQWVTFVPYLLVSLTNNLFSLYLLVIIEILLGSYIIVKYKLPRPLFLLAVFVPGLSILYFLIYGLNRQYKLG